MGRDLHFYVIENEEEKKEYEDPEVIHHYECIGEARDSNLPLGGGFYTTKQIAALLCDATADFIKTHTELVGEEETTDECRWPTGAVKWFAQILAACEGCIGAYISYD